MRQTKGVYRKCSVRSASAWRLDSAIFFVSGHHAVFLCNQERLKFGLCVKLRDAGPDKEDATVCFILATEVNL